MQSEDCLTLDVFTPGLHPAKPAPVLVWIHGGGFTEGTGIAPEFDGKGFTAQGVVLVNINYRLGRFGFFAHPALTREAAGRPGANYGLMDQVAALRWVRDNIRSFGGDPGQITIAGSSAGGASVDALMVSPAARGLFQRAISQSGLGREHTQGLAAAERRGVDLARRWGITSDDPKALRSVPGATILSTEADDPNSAYFSGEYPIIDGTVLPEPTLKAFEAGHEAPVPLIIGGNALELPVAVQPPFLKAQTPSFESLPDGLKAVYAPQTYAAQLPTDVIFLEPTITLGAAHARRAPTYVYRFAIVADPVRKMLGGAFHSSETQYVFQTYATAPYPMSERDRTLGVAVGAYWARFITNGDPNGADQPAWPRFANDRIMTFTNDGPQPGADPAAARLAAVAKAQQAGVAPPYMGGSSPSPAGAR